MPRVNKTMRNDPNRARYYRARADRIEAENTLKQQELISKEMVATNLQGFCKAIEGKIRASKLGPELKAEVSEDLGDFLQKAFGERQTPWPPAKGAANLKAELAGEQNAKTKAKRSGQS